MRTRFDFENSDFTTGVKGWDISKDKGDCAVVDAPAGGPEKALEIVTDHARNGARIAGPMVPCQGPGIVELHGWTLGTSGRHLGLWLREYDADGLMLPSSQNNWSELGDTGGVWQNGIIMQVVLDERTRALQLFLVAYPGELETINVYLGGIHFVRVDPPIPPWQGQYKLRPSEKERLTAADVVGPDGLVYPDWTRVGVQGGIPEVPVAVQLAERGAKPGDEISGLLSDVCEEVGTAGGGAILLEKGIFFLDHPVHICQSGVVIRGAGRDDTRLVFRYAVGMPGIDAAIYWPGEGGAVGPDTRVELHFYHMGVKNKKILLDGEELEGASQGYYNRLTLPGAKLLEKKGKPGPALLRFEVEYEDGHRAVDERRIVLTPEAQPLKSGVPMIAAIFFEGRGLEETEYRLAVDGKRGDTTLVFENASDLAVGERIELHAPGTRRFQEQIQHLQGGDDWKRVGFYEIMARAGNRLTINQPLRIDFPVVDGSNARRVRPIENCGVEHLGIEHTSRISVHSVMFDWGWNSWIRDIRVVQSGSCGAYAERSKWIEIRKCELDGAWNFDGGQAYAGFTSSADCLFDDNVVLRYRHGPCVQYGAMGNVFRNSLFEGSDLQWHAGWSTENLFENCVVHSHYGGGSYGGAAYATGSDDPGHGPNGPRNVVYNCDLSGESRGGVILNGVNEAWMWLHNRIIQEAGAGFCLRCGSFDHTIAHNVVVLEDGVSPLLRLKTPDCVGIDLVCNTLVGGNGQLVEGAAPLAHEADNRILPAGEVPDRPTVTCPSIYAWQQEKIKRVVKTNR